MTWSDGRMVGFDAAISHQLYAILTKTSLSRLKESRFVARLVVQTCTNHIPEASNINQKPDETRTED